MPVPRMNNSTAAQERILGPAVSERIQRQVSDSALGEGRRHTRPFHMKLVVEADCSLWQGPGLNVSDSESRSARSKKEKPMAT